MSEETQQSVVPTTQNEPKNINPYIPPEERIKRFEVAIKREFLKEIIVDASTPAPAAQEARANTATDGSAPELSKRRDRPYEDKKPPKKKGRYTKRAKRERAEQLRKTLFQGVGICNSFSTGRECSKTP